MKPQIRQRNGKFTAVVEVWSDGKRKVLTAGTHATEEEAQDAGWALARQHRNPNAKAQAMQIKLTLGEWLDQWVGTVLPGTVKHNTLSTYRWRCGDTGWLAPIREEILQDLTSATIEQWLTSLKLSPQSKRNALATLKAALQDAVKRGHVLTNPATGVDLRQSRAMKKQEKARKIKSWTEQEATLLLSSSQGTTIEAAVLLGLNTGCRLGELCGLQWCDLDVLTGQVHIHRNIVQLQSGGLHETTPKSGEERTVHVAPDVVDRLLLLRPADALDSDRIVPLHPQAVRKALSALCKAAGVPGLPPHSLRHTFATLLLSAGVAITAVSKALGHSNSAITLTTYAHALPKDMDLIPQTLARILNPTQTPVKVS